MMTVRSPRILLAFGVAALLTAIAPQPVWAESEIEDRSATPLALANPQVSDDLLESLPASILENSSIWVDPSIPPGTAFLILHPYGRMTVAEGQTERQQADAAKALEAQRLATCYTNVAVPSRTTIERSASGCPAIIETTPDTMITYTVARDQYSNGFVSWVPWSFKKTRVYPNPPPSNFYYWRYTGQWNPIGGANNMSVRVPWGEVAAYPKIKFTNGGYIGWAGSFHV